MIIKILKLHKDTQVPKKASELAGGWDVTCTEIIRKEHDFVICNLGFAMQPPKGYKITLVPRSSLTKTKWILQNSPGLGDEDFIGEYSYRFRALPQQTVDLGDNIVTLGYPEFPYKEGDRIGQMYLEEVIPIEFEEVESLEESKRSKEGFGSTGK